MNNNILKRSLISFTVFFIAILCISRVIYKWSLPRVTLCFSGPMAPIDRMYNLHGRAVLTDAYEGFTAVTEVLMEDLNSSFGGGWSELNDEIDAQISRDSAPDMVVSGDIVDTRTDEYQRTYLLFAFNLDGVLDDDAVTVKFSRLFATHNIVPSDAVRRDYMGEYILRVNIFDTVMGREFVTVREDVMVRAKYNGLTCLMDESPDILADLPVVLYADRPLEAGDAVRFSP